MRALRMGLSLSAAAAMIASSQLGFAAEPGPDALPISVVAIKTDAADDQAEALTKALRNAVRVTPGWSLGEGDFSLEVLTLTLKCADPPDASCQSRIADQIKSDRYVWGTIEKKGGTVHGTLNLWVRGKGTSKVPLDYTANLTDANDDTLRKIAAQAINDLTGGPPKGGVHIKAGEVQGQAFADGQPLGALKSGDGSFMVPSGTHKITVRAQGYEDTEAQVAVTATGAPAELRMTPVPVEVTTPINWRRIGGFTAIGVGAATGVVALVGSLQVNSVRNDPAYKAYAGSTVTNDVCVSAAPGGNHVNPAVDTLCNKGKTFEVVQAVLYPLAAISAGLGIYLVATSSSSPKGATSGFKIDPQLGLSSGKLDVTYTW